MIGESGAGAQNNEGLAVLEYRIDANERRIDKLDKAIEVIADAITQSAATQARMDLLYQRVDTHGKTLDTVMPILATHTHILETHGRNFRLVVGAFSAGIAALVTVAGWALTTLYQVVAAVQPH